MKKPKPKSAAEHSDPRMRLTLKDMPKYKGEIECLRGDLRDHYPDGTHKSRFQRPWEDNFK